MLEQSVISQEIIEEIHLRSQGIPRLINAICDNLLLTAFATESKSVTLEMLDEITADMRLDYSNSQRSYISGREVPAPAALGPRVPTRRD
jgi:hypothetical protein